MKKEVIFALLTSLATPVWAESAHIADDVYVFMNSGPSNQYRISGRVASGEAVQILNSSGNYIQIKTENGRTGWVPKQFVASGPSDLIRMPLLEKELAASKQQLEQQAQKIETLENSNEVRLNESEKSRAQVVELQQEISELKAKINNMDQSNLIRWLTHGGLVALGGVLIGLLVPYLPRRRKTRNDWL